jgi:hypothetical protein
VPPAWRNTTHDWSRHVDLDHLELIRGAPAEFAPNGVPHLVFEVLAYAADEASESGRFLPRPAPCPVRAHDLHADFGPHLEIELRGSRAGD